MNEQLLSIELGIELSIATVSEKESIHLLKELLELDSEECINERFSKASIDVQSHVISHILTLFNQIYPKFQQVV